MGDGVEVRREHQVQFLHSRSFASKMNSRFEVGIRQSREAYRAVHREYMRREVGDDVGFVDGNGVVEMGGWWCGLGGWKEENVLGG